MPDLKIICEGIKQTTATVGKFILNERKNFKSSSIEKKGFNDLVSYVDKESEKLIVAELKRIFPEAGFITEENTEHISGKEYSWIIDPLDGTTNFIHGMPCFCISIALSHHKEIVAGVIHELNLDECFSAYKNGGAFMNDKKIAVSDISVLAESLLATGFPYHDYSRMKPYMEIFDHCMRNSHGLRRLGSAAADLAYVACGRFEGFYEYGLNAWDVAAGAILVKEAGGIVTDFDGSDDFIFGGEMVATNPHIAAEFLNVVKEKFSYYNDFKK